MKKIVFYVFVLTFLSITFPGLSQLRHDKGINAVGASLLLTKTGSGAMFEFSHYLSQGFYFKGGIGLEGGKENLLKYKGHIFDVSGIYSPIIINNKVFINIQGGLNASQYKMISEGYRDEKATKFGPFIGLEVEGYITYDLILVLNTNQRFFFKDDFGKNRHFISLGIKYQIL